MAKMLGTMIAAPRATAISDKMQVRPKARRKVLFIRSFPNQARVAPLGSMVEDQSMDVA